MNMLCTRCKQRMAVVFMTRIEGSETVNEGLCLKCAKELGIKPVNDLVDKMGISDEDIENMNTQLMDVMDEFEGEGFEMGGAQPFPFLQGLFGQGGRNEIADNSEKAPSKPTPKTPPNPNSNGNTKPNKKASKNKFLDNYCENLTVKAREGRIDTIVGRNREIYRLVQILNRRTKNNPCLIGEPGVGKTAIAEGIAIKIAQGDVPSKLLDKEIYLLDLAAMVAGTQFRGQFESRMKGLVDEVKQAGNIILFIDEVHSLVGAGDSEGSMNAANILKPALSRGEVQVIGATTFNEYRKYIEKDAALERRFQPVTVEEPSIADTCEMLRVIKRYYEQYHRVIVPNAISDMSVTLSERYLTDRFLPDKAIDLLDEACSYVNLNNKTLTEYDNLNRKLSESKQIEQELETASDEVDYQKLAEIRAEIARDENTAKSLEQAALSVEVELDDLAKVIEIWTGIPSSKIRENELQKVANLTEKLMEKIIGQNEAVELVSAAIRRARVQLSIKRRPASFIFVGPTGVGKTELVKVLSQELFDGTEPFIRLDMSEFMEKHAVSRIIGAPPGYVGYDEAGQLTEKIRRRPYSIVLFDEIEKAHPDVMNILLQILDEGKVTDAHGRVVSFENTIIIMTSNAGSDKSVNSLGFTKTAGDVSRDKAEKALREFLRPEFLGRIDEVVVFRPLDKLDYQKIAKLMLSELEQALAEKSIRLTYDDSVLAWIADKAFGSKSGARDLRRVIRREIEDKIAILLVEGYDKITTEFVVFVDQEKIKIEAK